MEVDVDMVRGSRVLIVGAGVSRAISDKMPLTVDLREPLHRGLGVKPGSDIEGWLAYLGEDQPYLHTHQNYDNRALFHRASSIIARTIVEASTLTRLQPPPEWLCQLLLIAYRRRWTIVSFNYDDLIERAVAQLGLRPKHIGPRGRCTLLKLHGSINESWDPATRTVLAFEDESDRRHLTAGRWLTPTSTRTEWQRPGLWEPFIVPPTSGKSSFYGVPELRDRWLRAADALEHATAVDLLGYSFPDADHSTATMIARSVSPSAEPPVEVGVADLDSEAVRSRLRRVSGRDASWTEGGSSALATVVRRYIRFELMQAADVIDDVVTAGSLDPSEPISVRATFVSSPQVVRSVDLSGVGETFVGTELLAGGLSARLRRTADAPEVEGRAIIGAEFSGADRAFVLTVAPRSSDFFL